MKRASVWDFIEKISKETDLVGFTIAEYMPWSAMQMRELMKRTGTARLTALPFSFSPV